MNNWGKVLANTKNRGGFFGALRNRITRRGGAQTRSTSSSKLTALINFLDKGGSTGVGDPYQNNITVFRCVNQIATTLAQVPMSLYRGEDKVQSGPVYELLKRPNPLMGHTKFVHTVVAQELLHGASYVFLDSPDSRGVPRALLPLTPRMVAPVRPKGNLYDLRGWQLGADRGAVQVTPERIARFEYAISDVDPLLPVSPLEVASMAVQTDHLSATWNRATLENSGAPAGILKWTGEGRLDEKDAGLIRDQWLDSYGGAANADSIAVLGNNFDFQAIGQAAKDMQLSEGRRWNLAEIARAFNVPTLYLNEYSANGLSDAGLKVQERLFYHNTIQPIAAVFSDVMNRMVVQAIEPDLKLVWEWGTVEALREDYGGKLKHADQLWRLGYPINTVNEKLELGMPNLPWGDEAFVQAQMITAQTAVEQSEMLFGAQNPATEGEEVEATVVEQSARLHYKRDYKNADISTRISPPQGTTIQSLILSKDVFKDVDSAIDWVEENGFTVEKIDETDTSYRFRQLDPDDFEENSFRTVELSKGVKAVIGFLDTTDQLRAVDVPSFVSENARRGLKYHKLGKSGDGVTDKTLREARRMVEGSVSEDKVMRMAAWFKRHKSDLDAPRNSNPNHEDYPGAGAVAWMLWGGNPTSDPMRASDWADRKLKQLQGEDGEDRRAAQEVLERTKNELDPICKSMVGRLRRSVMKQRSRIIGCLTEDNVESLMVRVEAASRAFDTDEFTQGLLPLVSEANAVGVRSVEGLQEADQADLTQGYIQRRRSQIDIIANRMKDKANYALLSAYADGKDAEEVAQCVRDAFNGLVTNSKCKLIAQSEARCALNTGRNDAMKLLGTSDHRWVTPEAGCPAKHPSLDGSEQQLGDKFSRDKGLAFPCDPLSEPSSVIGCRCISVPCGKVTQK